MGTGESRAFSVCIGGVPLLPDMAQAIRWFEVESTVHLPSVATFALRDHDNTFVDDLRLMHGLSVTIEAAGLMGDETIFDGEIVELEAEFQDGASTVVVRAFDRLHKLSRGTQARTFVNMSDADIASKIAMEHGLRADTMAPGMLHELLFQDDESDLALLQQRARDNGFMLAADGKALVFRAPMPAIALPIFLNWGDNLLEFRGRLSTLQQATRVEVGGWDPLLGIPVVGMCPLPMPMSKNNAGLTGATLLMAGMQADPVLHVGEGRWSNMGDAMAHAQALATSMASEAVEAEGVVDGDARVMAGAEVVVQGVGSRFGGTYFVTRATHVYDRTRGYQTSFEASGLEPATLLSLVGDPAPRRRPGVVIGQVTDVNDPLQKCRVKVKFPWLSSMHASGWARVVVPGAGMMCGAAFLPDMGDDVVVAFEHGRLERPVVLGGVWEGTKQPPQGLVAGGKVGQRTLASPMGLKLVFDDLKGTISLQDPTGNLIELGPSGITIESSTSCKVSAPAGIALNE